MTNPQKNSVYKILTAPSFIPAVIFLTAFGFLVFSAAPTLFWGDSAEFTTTACTLGTAHSPGYPLVSLAGRLATAIPLQPFPFRTHQLSMLFSALTAMLFFVFLFHLTRSRYTAVAGTILFFTSSAFLTNSLYIEVYSLHTFIFTTVLVCLICYEHKSNEHWLWLALFATAVGLTHHILTFFVFSGFIAYLFFLPSRNHRTAAVWLLLLFSSYIFALVRSHDALKNYNALTILVLAGGWCVFAFYLIYLSFDAEKKFKPALNKILTLLLISACGAFFFLFLPLASAREPGADWWNPEIFSNFRSLLFLHGYSATFPENLVELLKRLKPTEYIVQITLPFLVLALPGLIVTALRCHQIFVMLLITMLLNFAGSLMIEHGKPEALKIPILMILVVFSMQGLVWLLGLRIFRGSTLRRAISVPVYVGAMLIVASTLPRVWGLRMTDSASAYEHGRGIVTSLPSDSLIFIGVQTPSITGYFEDCEDKFLRDKNIAIIPVSFLSFQWKQEQLKRKYPWLKFPTIIPEPEEKDLFKAGGEFNTKYIARMIIDNRNRVSGFYSDLFIIAPQAGFVTAPYGYAYRLLPTESVENMRQLFTYDFEPHWTVSPQSDETSRMNVSSIYNERGNLYMQYGINISSSELVEHAIDEFDSAIRLKSDYPDPYSNKGTCLLFLGKYKEAVELQRKAVKLAPDRPELLDQLAATYFRRHTRKSLLDAIAAWSTAVILEPKNPRYHHNLGTVFVALKNYSAAIASYNRAIELNPKYIEAYINLGRIYLAMGNCGKAIESVEFAKDINPQRLDVRSELIVNLYDCGMMRLFENELDSLKNEFPHDAAFYHSLGTIYRDIGKIPEAIQTYREARKIDPDYQLANLFESITDCKEGLVTVWKAASLEPDDPGIRILLASRYYQCGREEDAGAVLKEAIARFPDNQVLKTLLQQLESKKR
ncbi:MAG: tetratricopeptide repeat protein [bacterium]